ncbi:MAG: hypothetical protein QG597_3919 [Actinomycetota bacterium]|nr:hypothetical protein [Actinomycetota bacterium]
MDPQVASVEADQIEAAAAESADAQPADAALPTGPKHPLLLYTLARLGLLVVVGALLYVVGARSWLLVLLALLISGLLSYIVLGRLRDGVSAKVAARVDAGRERRAAATAEEDDLY